jgi:hypothetical protein
MVAPAGGREVHPDPPELGDPHAPDLARTEGLATRISAAGSGKRRRLDAGRSSRSSSSAPSSGSFTEDQLANLEEVAELGGVTVWGLATLPDIEAEVFRQIGLYRDEQERICGVAEGA